MATTQKKQKTRADHGAAAFDALVKLDAIVTTHAADLLDLQPEEQDAVMNRVAAVLANLRRGR